MNLPQGVDLNQISKLYAIVDYVRIVYGRVEDDPTIWEFHILTDSGETKIIKIDATKLERQSVFRS
jgi:hypothetical protein